MTKEDLQDVLAQELVKAQAEQNKWRDSDKPETLGMIAHYGGYADGIRLALILAGYLQE